MAKGNKPVGFAIAGDDHKWVWADAKIEGNSVVVSSSQVPNSVAVRYAWHINPICNLYNKAGLPASPFRTDDWPGVTANAKISHDFMLGPGPCVYRPPPKVLFFLIRQLISPSALIR